jgi:hypothetical protein
VLKCSSCEEFSFPFVVQMSLIVRETRECCPMGFPAGADLPKLTIALSPKTIRILRGGKLSALIFIDPSFSSIRSFPGCFFTSRLLTGVITSFLLSSVFLFFVYFFPLLSVIVFFSSLRMFCLLYYF